MILPGSFNYGIEDEERVDLPRSPGQEMSENTVDIKTTSTITTVPTEEDTQITRKNNEEGENEVEDGPHQREKRDKKERRGENPSKSISNNKKIQPRRKPEKSRIVRVWPPTSKYD